MQLEGNLLQSQRRLLATLREPIFGASRARTELPHRDGATTAQFKETTDELLFPNATLTAQARWELYHRQYWYRLLDSVAEDYPATRALLGDAAFFGLLEAYLEAQPPRGHSLLTAGDGLPTFIEANPHLVSRARHALELARLESACLQSAHAPEKRRPRPEALMGPLTLQPHVHLLALHTRADVFQRRVEHGEPAPVQRATRLPSRFLVVHRHEGVARVLPRPPAAHALLTAIARHRRLDAALATCVAEGHLDPRRDAPAVEGWFREWTELGLLTCEVE